MTPGEWVELMQNEGDSDYDIAYFVLCNALEHAEFSGYDERTWVAIEASILVSEYDLDELDVENALEDVGAAW